MAKKPRMTMLKTSKQDPTKLDREGKHQNDTRAGSSKDGNPMSVLLQKTFSGKPTDHSTIQSAIKRKSQGGSASTSDSQKLSKAVVASGPESPSGPSDREVIGVATFY